VEGEPVMTSSATIARVPRWLAVLVLALLPLSLAAACGGGADVQDVTENENIFHDEEYIGQTVTVTAKVTGVIGAKSFAIGGQEYGEDSLLVLTEKGTADVHKGEVAHVTGKVERFTFDDYVDLYGLDDERDFEAYHDKQILIAESIRLSVPDDVH
jgi:hypothetical protein